MGKYSAMYHDNRVMVTIVINDGCDGEYCHDDCCKGNRCHGNCCYSLDLVL